MVVFSSKSSSAKTKLFEQPLDKLFSPKAIKQLNEAISASSSRLALSSSLSVPLTSSTGLTWAKLSQDNSTAKRRRTLARLRRFTIDANNNANLVQAASCISSPPEALLNQQQHQQLQKLHASLSTAAISSPTTTTSTSAQPGAASTSSPQATLLSTLPNASIVQFSSEQHNHHRLQNNCASSSAASCAAPNRIDEEDERARLLLNVLPEPIKCLLNELYLRGPETVGIFRKSPNAKHCRELRQELEASDGQQQSLIEQFQVTVIASVFKEWLRSLPDCLLMSRLYPQWIDVAKLIEPLHLDKQHQQQLAQQISGNIDSYGVAQNAAIASSSSSSPPSSPSPTSSIGNKQASAIGDSLHRNAPLDLQSDFAANNVCGDQQQRHQSERELSRALSCSAVTSASDSGHSSTSPSSSFEADSSSRSPPGPPYPMSLAITRSNHNLEMERQQQQQQQQQPVVGRYSRQRDSANGAAGRLRYRSEDLSRDNEQSRALAEMMRPPMSPFELRERHSECIRIVRQLLDLLNEANLILLRAIICVLWHIADNSEHNKMSAQNLGVCVGQSLLNDEHQLKKGHTSTSNLYTMRSTSNLCAASPSSAASALKHLSTSNFVKRHRRARSQCLLASTISLTNLSHLSTSPASNNGGIASPHNTSTSNCSAYLESSGAQEAAKYVPILVAFMIDNAKTLFGSDIVNLFGKQRQRQSAAAAAIDVNHQRAAVSAYNLQEPNSQRECSNRSSLTTSTAKGPPASQQQDLQQLKSDDCVTASTSACVAGTVAMSDSRSNNINADLPSNQTEETITSTTSTPAAVAAAAAAAGTTINEHECRGAQEPDELKKQVPITATQRLCRNLSSDLVIRSSTDLLNNSAAPSAFKQHRRNPSTSIVVQIGAIAKAHDFSRAAVPCDRSADGDKPSAASCSSSSEQAGTTTSILIVNTPKRTMPARPANDCQASNQSTSSCCSEDDEVDSCRQRSSSQSVSPSCGSQSGCSSADSQAKQQQQQQQQQRPLSAAESTSSSSRASSSTSGVHSESPALSSETDTRHHCGGQATTCSSSMSASISSPDPSSSTPSTCTSPVDMVDGQNVSIVDKSSKQSANGGSTTDNKGTSAFLTRLSRRSRYTGGERPKSMVSLSSNELLEFRSAGANSLSPSDVPLGSCNQTYTNKKQQQQLAARDYVNFVPNQQQQQQRSHSMQSQTLNRYSSASSHQVATDRTPKLPFQYTTSCYGGEAVLYYPSNAHLSQHKRQKQQPQPQTEPRQEFQRNYRVCTRIQSLDRHHAQHQQPWDQQHQAPQRSHVMMLRDYYLSLQQQQQQRQQLQQQRRSSPNVASINHLQRAQQIQRQHSASQQPMLVSRIHHQHTPSQNELARLQYQQQQQHGEFAAQAHGDSLLYHQQSAAAYQRIQPRLAKVRANQFNSLYVKRAPSPSHLVVDAATITAGSCASNKGNSGGLIVRPLGKLEGGHCGPASIMAVSQSSLSQQSSKMSSTSSTEHSADDGESDDCSTGEWMESTMV